MTLNKYQKLDIFKVVAECIPQKYCADENVYQEDIQSVSKRIINFIEDCNYFNSSDTKKADEFCKVLTGENSSNTAIKHYFGILKKIFLKDRVIIKQSRKCLITKIRIDE